MPFQHSEKAIAKRKKGASHRIANYFALASSPKSQQFLTLGIRCALPIISSQKLFLRGKVTFQRRERNELSYVMEQRGEGEEFDRLT